SVTATSWAEGVPAEPAPPDSPPAGCFRAARSMIPYGSVTGELLRWLRDGPSLGSPPGAARCGPAHFPEASSAVWVAPMGWTCPPASSEGMNRATWVPYFRMYSEVNSFFPITFVYLLSSA